MYQARRYMGMTVPFDKIDLERYDVLALMSAVLVLAYAVDRRVHEEIGCDKAVEERCVRRPKIDFMD